MKVQCKIQAGEEVNSDSIEYHGGDMLPAFFCSLTKQITLVAYP